MKMDKATFYVKQQLTKKRFEHSERVVTQALKLAKCYNIDQKSVQLAAILHDCAKDLPQESLCKIIKTNDLPDDLLDYHHELWHGPVGSVLVAQDLGITDIDIQQAVRYHTTGRPQMSVLELIIYVADYIEPARSFNGVDEVRKIAQTDLVHAAWLATRNTMQFLLQTKAQIYPDTNSLYNDLTKQLFNRKQINDGGNNL